MSDSLDQFYKPLINYLKRYPAVSLQASANALNITIERLQDCINKLNASVHLIEYVSAYRIKLIETIQFLDRNQLLKHLHQIDALNLFVLDKTVSTNTFLLNRPLHTQIQICVAEQQTAGKGQYHRNWASPFGQNLYLSIKYPTLSLNMNDLPLISVVSAISVIQTLAKMMPELPLQLKWPNDVMVNYRKLAGLLIESFKYAHYRVIVVGLGLNINMQQSGASAIDRQWSSLRKETNHRFDRHTIVIPVINQLLNDFNHFSKYGIEHFRPWLNQYDCLRQKYVHVRQGHHLYKGYGNGIDDEGNLLLIGSKNESLKFNSGHIQHIT
jgi:BirA family biotin operon repressor/biotin-[acetyl-CoA-carboxylase] ligase